MGFFDWLFGKKKIDSNDAPAADDEPDIKVGEKNPKRDIVYSSTKEVDGEKYEWKQYSNGGWSMESSMGEPFKTYFALSDIIVHEKDIYAKLSACEESFKILAKVMKLEIKDSGKIPNSIACRDYSLKIYLQLGQWNNALNAIQKCIKANAYYPNKGELDIEYYNKYKRTAEIAISFLEKNEGFLQKNIYKALTNTDIDKECLKDFSRSSLLIKKIKKGGTNQLFLNEEILKQSDIRR